MNLLKNDSNDLEELSEGTCSERRPNLDLVI